MANFDKTLPNGALPFNQGDNDIRANMAAIEERLAKEHDFPQNPFTSRSGRHIFGRGTNAARDAAITAAQDGNVWFDTDRSEWQVRSGGVWIPTAGAIVGEIRMLTHGLGLPFGWRECNGQSLSTTTHAALFAKVGYLYGGAGPNFNVPDLRGRTPVGRQIGGDGDGDYATLGVGYGAKRITLTTNEMPAHNHPGSSIGNTAAMTSSGSVDPTGGGTGSISSFHTHSLTIASQGNGTPFDNRPLMLTLLFMIYSGA